MYIYILLKIADTTLFGKVCQWLVAGRWCSPGTSVSFTNETDDIIENIVESGVKHHNIYPWK